MLPAASSTRRMPKGAACTPRVAKTVYADTISMGYTSPPPMAVEGTVGIRVDSLYRNASPTNVLTPISRPNWIAIKFRDVRSPCRKVIGPR